MSGSFEKVCALPGDRLAFNEKDAPCDFEGCGNIAMGRVVTEADSAGVEYEDYCGEHLLTVLASIREGCDRVGACELCNNDSLDLRHFRDPEEGSYGPIYVACPACRDRLNSQFFGEGAEDVDPLDTSMLNLNFNPDD